MLGAISAEGASGSIDLGGPRQRSVLAILLIARENVVSMDRIVDDLWNGEPPARAIGALQAYISNLRRALEPGRAPRTPSSILISKAPGYALRLPVESVDAWQFDALVRGATGTDRREMLTDALALWRGDAYAEVAGQPWAQAEIARLTELRTVARERLVAAMLDDGSAADAVLDATDLTREHPLREESWRLLALALYRAGRQADALSALRRARTTLGDELGLDPGPALVELEADVLAHRVSIPKPVTALSISTPAVTHAEFFGRIDEIHAITETTSSIVLVSGEAGSGKSALLAQVRARLEFRGWSVFTGRCPESGGAPPAWAWTEILRTATASVDPGVHADALAPLLDVHLSRAESRPHGSFLLRRAVVDYLSEISVSTPLALVLDDLHRADPDTLSLLVALARESSPRMRIVAAYRPDETNSELDETIGSLAAQSPTRLPLGGLSAEHSAALVEHVSGRVPDDHTMRTLDERTQGNPFYLRESALLLGSEGDVVATSEVPEGVRDVLRRRFARLPELTVVMLRLTAMFGREAELDIVLEAAELDTDTALDALDVAVVAGLIDDSNPERIRFTHVLVRDTLYSDMTLLRRRRWHTRIGALLERQEEPDYPALALHYSQLSASTDIRKALDFSVAAAAEADSRYSHASAARFYTDALTAWSRLPHGSVEEHIDLLARRISAQVAGGASIGAAVTRREAVSIAERSGRTDLLIRTLTAGELPTTWLKREYGAYDAGLVDLIERALARDDLDDASACRLLCALVDEIRGELDDRAMDAAERAYALSLDLGEPEIRGLATNALWNLVASDLDPERRMVLSVELIELGTSNDMPVFTMIGHHGAFLVDAAEHRFESMRAHLDAESALAENYSWQQASATCQLARGMLAHAVGELDDAHHYFDVGGAALRASLAVNADVIHALAYVTTAVTSGTLGTFEAELRMLYAQYPDVAADLLALVLVERNELDEAIEVRRSAGRIRHDFFESLFLTLRGMAVVATDAVDEARQVYSSLARFSGRLAGIATGTYVIGPVDTVLASLAAALGETDLAVRHQVKALELAHAWGNPRWISMATRKPQEDSK